MLLENISLFWNLKTTLQDNRGYLIHLTFFFSGGHLSTHYFSNSDTCPFFHISFSFFMNNFCIAPCLFSATKLLRDSNKNLEHLFDGYPIKHVFVSTPTVGVKHFWVDLNEMAWFCAYPQCRSSTYVGGVYVILILRAWQTSHKGQQSLTKLNAKQSAYMWRFFYSK